ncbi:hypothetical protein ACOMHN_022754 [Nucella lapillus]
MERVIKSANFMHTNNDDLQTQFSSALSDHAEQSLTFPQLRACFKAAQAKLCRPDFPQVDSTGSEMARELIGTLMLLVDGLLDEGQAKATDINEMYLEFILSLIQVGPLSSHIEVIKMLMDDRETEFEDFYQTLSGDRLKGIVRSMKKEYKPDAGMAPKVFFEDHFEQFWRMFVARGLSEDQYKETRQEFTELVTFFNTSFTDKDEDTWEAMRNLADLIEQNYDDNIMEGVQDVSQLQHQFALLSQVILTPAFPKTEDMGDQTKDDLAKLLTNINEQGLICKLYKDIMDLALALTVQKAGCEGTRQHYEALGYFFSHIKEESVKNNKELFDGLMPKYLHFLNNVRDEVYLTYCFVLPVMQSCLSEAMSPGEDHTHQWIAMIKTLIKRPIPDCLETAEKAMDEKEKVLKWNKHPEDIKEMFGLLSVVTFPKWLTERQLENGHRQLEYLTRTTLEEAKKVGIVKLGLTEPIVQFIFNCLEAGTEDSYSLAESLVDRMDLNAKKDKALMMSSIQRVTTYLEDDSYDWEDDALRDFKYTLSHLVQTCLDSVKDGKMFTWEEYDDLIYLAKLCEQKMHNMSEPGRSVFFDIFSTVSMSITNWLQTMNEEHRLIPMVPCIISMLDREDESLYTQCTTLMTLLSHTAGNMFARYNEKLVTKFLDDENEDVLYTIINSYEFNKGPIEKRFDELFEHIDSGNNTVKSYILQILAKVAKCQPDLFNKEKAAVIVKEAKEDATYQVLLLMILGDIAKRHIDFLEPSIDDFMDASLWQPMSVHAVFTILKLYGLGSEEKADKVITYLIQRAQTSEDQTEVLVTLHACQLLGFKYRPAIEKHRATIEKFREKSGNNDYHTSSTAILDMLDGKSVDKISEELRELQGDVADLEVRVTATENDIAEVKDTVEQQGQDLDNVKNEVTEQGQRMDTVDNTIEDTKAKVEEIDSKTLSHAPYWSRDVSKLLNVEGDADWRLLSLRLGYTNDDIRAWAMQADPCMHMLNEWYATHKTREATHAILTSLQLLDREDAAVIVENAMKNAEAVVENEEFEYATPPDIFLSYQWGHQDEVRLLRQHLEMAGFSCWMDVGQMGGGDKLFEKIDSGIRGAKLVISCVTAKYAKSPNCNREVNLSVNLGKAIIPLLMEKTNWPPPGSMGPIFSEYLFIRFFQRAGEETSDQRYWPLAKFQELLMQLSVIGLTPDQQIVQPEYKDWWVPKVEQVTIDKDHAKKQTAASSAPPSTDDKASESPEVFISYQWGKQPQILKLYTTLTGLGYSCWLDIMQMGGGDSLYDKIDRGLRGCRVVLSCVTTKYAKSANCRREVSLADAVQKPLIPLLLESLTWPPPGPMSPILTQLLYIDCTANNMEDTWQGPKFDELLDTIDQHIPGKRIKSAEKPPSSSTTSAPKAPREETTNTHQSSVVTSQKTDSGRQEINGDKDQAKLDPKARKASVTQSMDSAPGHDGYNHGDQSNLAGGVAGFVLLKSNFITKSLPPYRSGTADKPRPSRCHERRSGAVDKPQPSRCHEHRSGMVDKPRPSRCHERRSERWISHTPLTAMSAVLERWISHAPLAATSAILERWISHAPLAATSTVLERWISHAPLTDTSTVLERWISHAPLTATSTVLERRISHAPLAATSTVLERWISHAPLTTTSTVLERRISHAPLAATSTVLERWISHAPLAATSTVLERWISHAPLAATSTVLERRSRVVTPEHTFFVQDYKFIESL